MLRIPCHVSDNEHIAAFLHISQLQKEFRGQNLAYTVVEDV